MNITSHENLKPIVYSIIIISFIGAAGILGIEIVRPGRDNSALQSIFVGFLMPTLMGLISVLKADQAVSKANECIQTLNTQTAELKQDNAQVAAQVVQQVVDIKDKAVTDVAIGAIAMNVAETSAAVKAAVNEALKDK